MLFSMEASGTIPVIGISWWKCGFTIAIHCQASMIFDPCRAPCHLSDLDPVEAEQGKVFRPETAQQSAANEPAASFK